MAEVTLFELKRTLKIAASQHGNIFLAVTRSFASGLVKLYKQLVVWQRAHQLVLEIYRMAETFPKYEQYGITSQIRRASVSVVINIVEGSAKKSKKDFSRFFDIAKGSLWKKECLLELARDLKYLKSEDCEHFENI